MGLDGAQRNVTVLFTDLGMPEGTTSASRPFYSPRRECILLLLLVESMPRLAPLDEAPLRFRSFANLALRILTPDGGQRDRA